MSKGNFIFILGMRECLCGESTVTLPILSDLFEADAKKMSEKVGNHWAALVEKLKEVPGFKTENKKFSKDAWGTFFVQYEAALKAEEISTEFVNQAFQVASAVMSAETAVNAVFATAIAELGENPSYEKWSELITEWTSDEAPATETEVETPAEAVAETVAETIEVATEELGTEKVTEIAEAATAEAATEIAADLTEAEKVEVIEAATEQTGGIVPANAEDALVILLGGSEKVFRMMAAQAEAAAKTSEVVEQIATSLAALAQTNRTVLTAMSEVMNAASTNLQGALQARLAPTVEAPQIEA